MSEIDGGYEAFEKWVNDYRDERDLPRLSKEDIKTCYDIIVTFDATWKEARK